MRSIGYSIAERVLEAEFLTGEIYRYYLVPETVWEELKNVASKGAFFNQRVRDRFPMVNVTPGLPDKLRAELEQSLRKSDS